MTSPDPKPLEVFKYADFLGEYKSVEGSGDGGPLFLCGAELAIHIARRANAKLAPLIRAAGALESAMRDDSATSIHPEICAILTAFRQLLGQEKKGDG